MNESEVKPPRLKERIETICKEMVEKGILFPEAMSQFERCFIMEVMRKSRGNMVRAAASLRIHRNTLSKKVRNHKQNHLTHP
jgi:DNA-binding protein Fis